MKKFFYGLLIVICYLMVVKMNDSLIIPRESLRFRIIANSNSNIDQTTKFNIRNDLANNFFPLLEDAKSYDEALAITNDNKSIINETINKYNIPYKVNIGKNYFPEKEYKGVNYEAGNYDSLVISLGEGKGDNWWCVMYPPLCLLDSKSNNYKDVEYKFYIKEIISKLTH